MRKCQPDCQRSIYQTSKIKVNRVLLYAKNTPEFYWLSASSSEVSNSINLRNLNLIMNPMTADTLSVCASNGSWQILIKTSRKPNKEIPNKTLKLNENDTQELHRALYWRCKIRWSVNMKLRWMPDSLTWWYEGKIILCCMAMLQLWKCSYWKLC